MRRRRHKSRDAALIRQNSRLRDELSQKEAQICELEKIIANLIVERDAADAALDQLVSGRR
jgi:hypothetical protein